MNETFYAIVYGNAWDDIMYFTDLEKAQQKLRVQSQCVNGNRVRMYEFSACEMTGVFGRCKHAWHVVDGNVVLEE